MLWQLHSFPPCTHHVFLSHCREDRRRLVLPLFKALRLMQILPWLDLHDYAHGRTTFAALRDGILQSRHTVFLVTPDMLAQPRGWTTVELAWAHSLQENLSEPGGALQNVLLPLFFVSPKHMGIRASVWECMRDRAVFCPPRKSDRVQWAAQEIHAFLQHEAAFGLNVETMIQQDRTFRGRLKKRAGLIERVTAQYPTPAPR